MEFTLAGLIRRLVHFKMVCSWFSLNFLQKKHENDAHVTGISIEAQWCSIAQDVVYPDQTFGSGYHSYGALAVTGTAPWNHSTPGKPVVDKVFLKSGSALGATVAKRLAADASCGS